MRGLSFAPGYSRYFFYACAALVAAFILFWSILISKYTKVRYISHRTYCSHKSHFVSYRCVHDAYAPKVFRSFILPACVSSNFYSCLFFLDFFVLRQSKLFIYLIFLDAIFSFASCICFQYNIWRPSCAPMHLTSLIFYILMCYSSAL